MKLFELNRCFGMVVLVLVAFVFDGCREVFPPCPSQTEEQSPSASSQPPDQNQGEPPVDPFITFDLPPGWEFHPQNHHKALWPYPSKDQKAPQVLLEFYTLEEAPKADPQDAGGSGGQTAGSGNGGQETGTGGNIQNPAPLVSAKDKILNDYKYKLNQCLASPACAQEATENQPHYLQIQVGQTTVYASESPDIYWSEPTWSSLIAFEKGGKVATFLLQDRAEYYQDALETIVDSFKTNIDAKGVQTIEPGVCPGFILDQIPVGNFEGFQQMPTDDLTIIQNFNTSVDEAVTFASSKVYGHTGVDLQYQPTSQSDGSTNQTDTSTTQTGNIYSLYPGFIILSQQTSFNAHWGEAVVVATRLSADSDQILTHHYYHLDYANEQGHYQTSRQHEACATVQSGVILAREGSSGAWEHHLHVGMRLWQNLSELKKALQNNAQALYGQGYVFDSEEKMAEFLDPACAWSSAPDCSAW